MLSLVLIARLQKLGAGAILAFALGTVPANAQQPGSESAPLPAHSSDDRGGSKIKKKFAASPALDPSWAPIDVDAAVPPVDATAPCSLPAVLKGAGERAQELVDSLPKFAATERMEHREADSSGKWGDPENVVFAYLVEMKQPRKGMLVMDEMRDGGSGLFKFPARLATLGLPALAMIFHPYFADEYVMKCEGLGNWDGYYAWQVHFQQRSEKLARLRSYRIKDRIFPVKLKGRAWISADNFQVLHIDTDIIDPVPEIQLHREHISVDYRPVHFRKENANLWLQQKAEVFMDYKGRRYRRLHTFTDFMMFSVDVDQKDKLPPAE